MRKFQLFFLLVLALVVLVIITGTVYAVLSGTRTQKLARQLIPDLAATQTVYNGIGRIRTKAVDSDALILVNIVFPYDAADSAWRDELSDKRDQLRSAAIAFFAGQSLAELKQTNEMVLKAALRDTLNQYLVLGVVEDLYFTEFDILP